jgi:hypothetical protein
MPPGNRGDIGKDQDGKSDGSWWGSNEKSNDHGGSHHTLYGGDGSRTSWDTDQDGNYVQGSGHNTDSGGRSSSWDARE